jgi:arylsulfatase A-like enzyme
VASLLRRLLDSPWTYFGLAGLLVIAAIASQIRIQIPSRSVGTVADLAALREQKTNVVFILIDTLRPDRLSAYGYERPTSPVLADLARVGVRFAHVEAQSSWTKTSMASLWTGLYPTRTGILRSNHAFPAEVVMPAEIFREAGYATAGLWRNGWVGQDFGFQQGFDTYLRPPPSPNDPNFARRGPGVAQVGGTDENVSDAAIGFLETHGREPFLLYLHYMDVHQYAYDQQAAKLGFGTSLSDAYDMAIHWVDRNVAAVLTYLERNDLFEKTLVVIASDHGESFREHGSEGHAKSLYQEVTRVPLIFALPFRLKPGVVVEPTVRNVDIWPTVLDLVGLPPLPQTDGRSLVPMIEAAARGEQDGAGLEAHAYLDRSWGKTEQPSRPMLAVLAGERRLVRSTVAEPKPKLELFDRATDPGEERDVAAEHPEWVAELEPKLDEQARLTPSWGKPPEVHLDELSQEMLRALGYVVGK